MSEYLAILALSPSVRYTIKRFWPFKRGQILRLLIISFFIGAWITSPFPQNLSYGDLSLFSGYPASSTIMKEASLMWTVMSGFLLIVLVYAFFSSIFQFIFVDYLSSGTKEILPSLRKRAGMGIRLLGFYLVTILIIGICAVISIMGIAVPVLVSQPDHPSAFFIALIYALAGLLILIIPVWMLSIITTDFVVPVMIMHTCGIIRGWKIFIQEIAGRWDELGIYLAVKIGINIVTGIVLGILLVGMMEGLGFSSPHNLMNFGFILPFLLMAVITLIIMTPVVTFLRYYALVFLHLLSGKYSLLPDLIVPRKTS